jgi:serine/threonine-protein kinase
MIKCVVCGTNNLEGSQFCDECGSRLANTPSAPAVQNSAPIESQVAASSVTSLGIPLIIEDVPVKPEIALSTAASQSDVSGHLRPAKLIVEKGLAVGKEFQLSNIESQIGRWDADNGIFPDVDLDAFDPEAKISRRHARIIVQSGRYMIEDLGSTNGTFINRGKRLIPGTPHFLNDGDEIIVGKTFLRFQLT